MLIPVHGVASQARPAREVVRTRALQAHALAPARVIAVSAGAQSTPIAIGSSFMVVAETLPRGRRAIRAAVQAHSLSAGRTLKGARGTL